LAIDCRRGEAEGYAMELMTALIDAVAAIAALGVIAWAGTSLTPQAIPVRVRNRRRRS